MSNSLRDIFHEILIPLRENVCVSNENLQQYLNEDVIGNIDMKRLDILIREGQQKDILETRGESAIRLLRKRLRDRASSKKYITKLNCDKTMSRMELQLLAKEKNSLHKERLELLKEISWYKKQLFFPTPW